MKQGKNSYERFYEGFTDEPVVRKDGGIRLVKRYTGPYYRRKCSARAWTAHRVRTALLYLAVVGVYFACALQDVWYNRMGTVSLMEGVVLVALLFFLLPLFSHVTTPPKMILRVYRDASRVYRRAALVCAVCFWGLAAAVLAGTAACRAELWTGVLPACGFAVCGGAMMLLYREEAAAQYEVLCAAEKEGFPSN